MLSLLIQLNYYIVSVFFTMYTSYDVLVGN